MSIQGYRYKAAAKALDWKVTVFKKRLELARGKIRVLLADFKLKGNIRK